MSSDGGWGAPRSRRVTPRAEVTEHRVSDVLSRALVAVERQARALMVYPWHVDCRPTDGPWGEMRTALARVEEARSQCVRATKGNYLVARVPGCICTLVDEGRLSGPEPYPPEWEQDPDCAIHALGLDPQDPLTGPAGLIARELEAEERNAREGVGFTLGGRIVPRETSKPTDQREPMTTAGTSPGDKTGDNDRPDVQATPDPNCLTCAGTGIGGVADGKSYPCTVCGHST